ncbi:MAG: hypothetical protein ACLVIY_08390 [Anaerobutyricum soehngenii]
MTALRRGRGQIQPIQVTFHKDNSCGSSINYRCLKQNGQLLCYTVSFDNYIQRYLNQRYLSCVTYIIRNQGIENSVKFSCEKECIQNSEKFSCAHGGNSCRKETSSNIMKTNKKGEKVLTQAAANVYKTDDRLCLCCILQRSDRPEYSSIGDR